MFRYTLDTGFHDDLKDKFIAGLLTFLLAAALPIVTTLLTIDNRPLRPITTFGFSNDSGAESGSGNSNTTPSGTANAPSGNDRPATGQLAVASSPRTTTPTISTAIVPPATPLVGGRGGGDAPSTPSSPSTCTCQPAASDGSQSSSSSSSSDSLIDLNAGVLQTQVSTSPPSITITLN